MTASCWTEAGSSRAREIWLEYAKRNSLAERSGQTVGIDPVTGQVWIGRSIREVNVQQIGSVEEDRPLYFLRLGPKTYYVKGGHS